MYRSEDGALPASVMIIGLCLVGFGFMIYYLMPLSLLSLNFSVLLEIFVGLLLGMLFGMVMLALNMERILQKFLIFSLFFWEKSVVISMVSKNLVAHIVRNKKTSLMYALSLAFLIFISTSYSSQINSVTYVEGRRGGAYVRVQSKSFNRLIHVNTVNNRVTQLENFARANPYIQNVSWVTQHYLDTQMDLDSTKISTTGRIASFSQHLFACSPNIINVPDFSKYVGLDSTMEEVNGLDFMQQLYTIEGSHSAILGEVMQQKMAVQLNSTFEVDYVYKTSKKKEKVYLHTIAYFKLIKVDTIVK